MNSSVREAASLLLAEWKAWVVGQDRMEVPELLLDAAQNCREALRLYPASGTTEEGKLLDRILDNMSQLDGMLPSNLAWWDPWAKFLTMMDRSREGRVVSLESVKLLLDQKVSQVQICKIYGWLDPSGRPETWKVEEEAASPGKWTKDHVSDAEMGRRRRIVELRQGREELWKSLEKKLQRMMVRPPENLVDLLAQRISGRQICSMLEISKEQLQEQCDEIGVDTPGWDYADVRTARAPMEPGISEAAEKELDTWAGHGGVEKEEEKGGNKATAVIEEVIDKVASSAAMEGMEMADRVKYLWKEGFKVRQIKDALGLTQTQVREVLNGE